MSYKLPTTSHQWDFVLILEVASPQWRTILWSLYFYAVMFGVIPNLAMAFLNDSN
jgi:hypothetical protein